MPLYLVILGAPGAGKGTQARRISETMGIPHISSGDIFRENINNQTKLGVTASAYINRGELVPDDVTIGMIKERLSRSDCEKGAVLDGFPRTRPQAESLDEILSEFHGKVDVVPYIKVEDEVLIERLTGRWTCRENGHIFHELFNPPKVAGVCDFDGSELYQREDDKRETVSNRIKVYMEQTAPLIAYYKDSGVLVEIDGVHPIDEVFENLMTIMPSR
ncbi:MAG: adenylate kinase [Anaerolineales bacterium]